jgi:hypothetical protein
MERSAFSSGVSGESAIPGFYQLDALEPDWNPPDNGAMNTTTTERPCTIDYPPEIRADVDAVVESLRTGIPVAPEVRDRMRALAEKIREETFRKHGLLDIGVPAIRELRGELPE